MSRRNSSTLKKSFSLHQRPSLADGGRALSDASLSSLVGNINVSSLHSRKSRGSVHVRRFSMDASTCSDIDDDFSSFCGLDFAGDSPSDDESERSWCDEDSLACENRQEDDEASINSKTIEGPVAPFVSSASLTTVEPADSMPPSSRSSGDKRSNDASKTGRGKDRKHSSSTKRRLSSASKGSCSSSRHRRHSSRDSPLEGRSSSKSSSRRLPKSDRCDSVHRIDCQRKLSSDEDSITNPTGEESESSLEQVLPPSNHQRRRFSDTMSNRKGFETKSSMGITSKNNENPKARLPLNKAKSASQLLKCPNHSDMSDAKNQEDDTTPVDASNRPRRTVATRARRRRSSKSTKLSETRVEEPQYPSEAKQEESTGRCSRRGSASLSSSRHRRSQHSSSLDREKLQQRLLKEKKKARHQHHHSDHERSQHRARTT